MKLRIAQLTALLILPLGSLIFYTLSMTGCVGRSTGIPNIYLVALNSTQEHELRVGYFGICLHHNASFNCVSTHYGSSTDGLYPRLTSKLADKTGTPLSEEVLSAALQLQRNVFFCFGAFCGLTFFISLLVCIVELIFRMRNRNQAFSAQQWPNMLLGASIVMSIINAAAIMQTANALEFATTVMAKGTITVKAGIALQVLAWLASGFSLMFYAVLISPNPPTTHGPRVENAKKPPLKISSPIPTIGSPMLMMPQKV